MKTMSRTDQSYRGAVFWRVPLTELLRDDWES
jgi:hypothetical protein